MKHRALWTRASPRPCARLAILRHERNAAREGVSTLLHLALGLFVLAVGALEGWFGRPELFGDDISYLDITHMIRAGDWRAALNPLWSIGYPLLLSAVRPLFPSTLKGELTAVYVLNLIIYIAAWLSFLWLLRRRH